jgi:7,8-dihydroneopterin aldolase/epimerase/oxygenase
MGQITLEGMEFFAFHGFYDEEQKIGNKYGVDLSITTDLRRAAETDDLDETVNYEVLYKLVLEEMKIPARLLEHLGHRIIDKVYDRFAFVQSVKINVYKYNPPLGGICKWAKVSLEEAR